MVWNPPAGVVPVDRKSPSAPTLGDIPAVLDWLRGYYPGHTIVGTFVTARDQKVTYRVDGEPGYGTPGTLGNYTLTQVDWNRDRVDQAIAGVGAAAQDAARHALQDVNSEWSTKKAAITQALTDSTHTREATELARAAMLAAGQYASLPSVALRADLPAGRPVGELRTVRDEWAVYRMTGGGWVLDTQLQRPLDRATYQPTRADLTPTLSTPQACVVFQADDARIETITWLEGVFAAAGVPCCLPVITSGVGGGGGYYLPTWDEVRRLQNVRGWEIMSHTVTHPYLAQLSAAQVETELQDSLSKLRSEGLNVESFVPPYGSDSRAVRAAIRRLYRSSTVSQWFNGTSGLASTPSSPVSQFRVARTSFDGNSLAVCKAAVDRAKAENGLLVFAIHPFYDEYVKETAAARRKDLADLLAYCAAQGVPVMNMRDALDLHGNVLDTGDKESGGGYLRVSRAGAMSSNVTQALPVTLARASRTNASVPADFPSGVQSSMVVYYADNGGFPTGAGILVTDRAFTDVNAPRFDTQTWYPDASSDVHRRWWTVTNGAGAWSAWAKVGAGATTTQVNPVYGTKRWNLTPANVLADFPEGVTYTQVLTANATVAAGYPEATGGTLVTTRLYPGAGEEAFGHQEYRVAGSARRWARSATGASAWSAWVQQAAVSSLPAPASIDLPAQNVPAASTINVTVDMPGTLYGQAVVASPQATPVEAGLIWSAHVAVNDKVTLRLANLTTAAVAAAARRWKFVVVG